MTASLVSLGGEAKAIKIAPVGFGLMNFTWRDPSTFREYLC